MPGLYSLDVNTQIIDDFGLKWDDPDYAAPAAPPTGPIIAPEIQIEGLGCGAVGCFLVRRATPTVIEHDLTGDLLPGYQCSRVLNDVSTASVALKDCYDGPPIQPWAHALLFTWDGGYFWHGPVTSVTEDSANVVQVVAADIMAWMRKRRLVDDFDSVGAAVDASAAFTTIVSDGFDQDATVSYVVTAATTGVDVERQFLATDYIYVMDAIDELVVTGCDWTVFLNQIICGDIEATVAPIFVLNPDHMKVKPSVTLAGDDQANRLLVVGGDGIIGSAIATLSTTLYGRLDFIDREADIIDSPSAADRAQGLMQFRAYAPTLIEGIKLLPTAPVQVNDLIPGVEFALNVPGNAVPFIGTARIESVEFADEDNDGHWHVTVHCNTLPIFIEE